MIPTLKSNPILIVSIALCFAAAAGACGKSEPCSGGGMSLDTKPVHAEWASRGGLPPGAVACASDGNSGDTSKLFELGANHDEGFDAMAKHYIGNGWKELDRSNESDRRNAEFERDGHVLTVGCSKNVKDKGWCNATLALKP